MLRHETQDYTAEILNAAPSDQGGQSFIEFQYRLFLVSARSSWKSAEAYWILRDAEHFTEAAPIARGLLERMFTVGAGTDDARIATEILAADNKKILDDTTRWIKYNSANEQPLAPSLAVLENADESSSDS